MCAKIMYNDFRKYSGHDHLQWLVLGYSQKGK